MTDFRQIRCVAFDLDGTLVDSAPDLATAVNLMLAELERGQFDEPVICSWVGNGARMLVARALSGAHEVNPVLTDEQIDTALAVFKRHYEQHLCVRSRLYPGVMETLERIRQAGLAMAVITNKPGQFTRPLLKALGLETFFCEIVSGDCLPERKPDPLPLTHVLECCGLAPQQMLMVGDSRNDILAARAAGCPSVGLTYGYNYGEPISVWGPDRVLEQFTELAAVLALPEHSELGIKVTL